LRSGHIPEAAVITTASAFPFGANISLLAIHVPVFSSAQYLYPNGIGENIFHRHDLRHFKVVEAHVVGLNQTMSTLKAYV
jgi:hypothetical protein